MILSYLVGVCYPNSYIYIQIQVHFVYRQCELAVISFPSSITV